MLPPIVIWFPPVKAIGGQESNRIASKMPGFLGQGAKYGPDGTKRADFGRTAVLSYICPMSSSPEWLSTQEAAAKLGVTPRTLYKLINDGAVPAYKIGRVIRLKDDELDTYISSARVQPGELSHLYGKSSDA